MECIHDIAPKCIAGLSHCGGKPHSLHQHWSLPSYSSDLCCYATTIVAKLQIYKVQSLRPPVQNVSYTCVGAWNVVTGSSQVLASFPDPLTRIEANQVVPLGHITPLSSFIYIIQIFSLFKRSNSGIKILCVLSLSLSLLEDGKVPPAQP